MRGPVSVRLTRLVISMVASILGVLVTAVLWKPGVIVGAALVPVIALFVESSFGEPLIGRVRPPSDPATLPATGGANFRLALSTGLIGFAIVGGALTVPALVEGDAFKDTPLVTGEVPIVGEESGGNGGSAAGGGGSDPDGDGRFGEADNCPTVHNPDQEDTNGSGRGDACDPDDDNDGHLDDADNCPKVINEDQADADTDGTGDACEDSDEDGHFDTADNCPTVANPGQEDLDEDGIGDACDDDRDGDGFTNDVDGAPDDGSTQ